MIISRADTVWGSQHSQTTLIWVKNAINHSSYHDGLNLNISSSSWNATKKGRTEILKGRNPPRRSTGEETTEGKMSTVSLKRESRLVSGSWQTVSEKAGNWMPTGSKWGSACEPQRGPGTGGTSYVRRQSGVRPKTGRAVESTSVFTKALGPHSPGSWPAKAPAQQEEPSLAKLNQRSSRPGTLGIAEGKAVTTLQKEVERGREDSSKAVYQMMRTQLPSPTDPPRMLAAACPPGRRSKNFPQQNHMTWPVHLITQRGPTVNKPPTPAIHTHTHTHTHGLQSALSSLVQQSTSSQLPPYTYTQVQQSTNPQLPTHTHTHTHTHSLQPASSSLVIKINIQLGTTKHSPTWNSK